VILGNFALDYMYDQEPTQEGLVGQPRKAASVEAERVDWLWQNRIPRGMLSLVAGKPDQGKGLFASFLAADVSSNGGRVLYSASEDSASLMTRPRLEAAGADLDNVLLWRFALPKNGRELGEIVVNEKIDLIVMDPLASHLTGGISRHSDNIRTVLTPLTELVESTGTAVLIIEHALKRVPTSGHPLDAIGGSGSGVPAACRTAFVFGKDPDDADRRILAPAKFNIGPMPKALTFEVDVEDLDKVGDVPFLEMDEELMTFDPMRLFNTKNQPGKVGRPADKRAAAAEWLTTYLAENGPTKSSTVQEDAKQYQMAAKTLRRAAEDMGVVKNPPGGGRNCTWDLPDEVKDLMGLPTAKAAPDPTGTTCEAGTEGCIVEGDHEQANCKLMEESELDAGLAELLGGGDEETNDAS
jgi:hypothetical protein